MICSQDFIRELADRIERAYRRRYPRWNSLGLTPGVWESAASRLVEASKERSGVPIDPELFVASQAHSSLGHDPWSELTQHRSLQRYIKALRRIIRQLRGELEVEVRRAECRLRRGVTLEEILAREGARISPLSRFILAHRAGRADLSRMNRAGALSQHQSCPLYRVAARRLLPVNAYPSSDLVSEASLSKHDSLSKHEMIAFSRN